MNRTSPNAKIFLHLKPQAVTSVFFDFFNLVVLQFKSVNLVAHLYVSLTPTQVHLFDIESIAGKNFSQRTKDKSRMRVDFTLIAEQFHELESNN